MGQAHPPIDLAKAETGDPNEQEVAPLAADGIEANDRRTIRQAIMTQLMREVADEIIQSGVTVGNDKGSISTLKAKFSQSAFPRLFRLLVDTEGAFNEVRNRLKVSRDFGSINLVVFRNAMAIGVNPDVDEVAKRVVIRSGVSGNYRARGFAGCK
jgi:hypothetical protein